jgi:hypothetical protein
LCLFHADNLAANFSRELADYIIYIIDVSGGDKIPRKGGPGITQADLLVRRAVFTSIIYNLVHLTSFVALQTYFDFCTLVIFYWPA